MLRVPGAGSHAIDQNANAAMPFRIFGPFRLKSDRAEKSRWGQIADRAYINAQVSDYFQE